MTEVELRQRVVNAAEYWLGANEADGTFRAIIDLYNSITPLPVRYKVKYTDEWCATFVSAVALQAGITDIMFPECGCERMIALYKSAGRWMEDDSYTPKPGDVFMYDWGDVGTGDDAGGADHVGIVQKVADGNIYIIEGNRSRMVKICTVPLNGKYIRGFCLPDYASKTASYGTGDNPSGWAKVATEWAKEKGIFHGDGNGNYDWQEPITREQVAMIMYNALRGIL